MSIQAKKRKVMKFEELKEAMVSRSPVMYKGVVYPEIALLGVGRIGDRPPCVVELSDKCGHSTVRALGKDIQKVPEEEQEV